MKKYFAYAKGTLSIGKTYPLADGVYPFASNGIVIQLYHPFLLFGKNATQIWDGKKYQDKDYFNFQIIANSQIRICFNNIFGMYAIKIFGFGIGIAMKYQKYNNE